MELDSVLTCPQCGHAEPLRMPTDACVFFHECSGCGVLLRPKTGDCCVFCSYGTVPCPPIQAGRDDCCLPNSGDAGAVKHLQGVTQNARRVSLLDRSLFRVADVAGVLGAIAAALCCAGTPLLVGALAVTGLTFLRRDAVLWPVMLVSLAIAIWALWRGFAWHRSWGPLATGVAGAVSLAAGVIVVHGPPAMTMIYGGAILLVIAPLWNAWVRRRLFTGVAAIQSTV